MLDKLKRVEDRYEELCARAEQPDFYADPQKAAKLLREKSDLEPIVEAFHAYNQAQQDMADAQELMADPEMKELCQETYAAAKNDASAAETTAEEPAKAETEDKEPDVEIEIIDGDDDEDEDDDEPETAGLED